MSKIRCAIYDRVSTDLQVQKGLSLDTQKELLTEYAQSNNYEIVDYYVDEGITARKKLQNRKDFMRLLEDIKKDKIDLVLVTKLDRWFRNVKDYHNTQSILESHHCNWRTILEDYDTSTADGQLKINIMLAVAQNESDRTSERIKVVFASKIRRGEHVTGAAPYGYILVNKKLEKDPDTCHIVDELFRYYFLHFSKRKAIYHILDLYGSRSPSIYQAERILKHETYAGLYKGTPGYCTPYISIEQFHLIQKVSTSKTYASSNTPYLFSQLIVCPVCGSFFTGFTKKQTLKDGSKRYYKRYRCCQKAKKKKHSGGGACISESVIERYMLQRAYTEFQDTVYLIKQIAVPVPAKDETKKITAELDRLTLLFQKGRIKEDYYETQYEKLSQELISKKETPDLDTLTHCNHTNNQFKGTWIDIYNRLDNEHKKSFWKRSISGIYIDHDTHKLKGFDYLKVQ